MNGLDQCWHAAWHDLQAARRRRDLERWAALASEIVRLACMFRARHRNWKRRQRYDRKVWTF